MDILPEDVPFLDHINLVDEIAQAEAAGNLKTLKNELDSLGRTTSRGIAWQEIKDFFVNNMPEAWQALYSIGGWQALSTFEGLQSFKDRLPNLKRMLKAIEEIWNTLYT